MRYWEISTPVGWLLLSADEEGMRGISFQNGSHRVRSKPDWRRSPESFRRVIDQLDAYFAGELTSFDIALAPRGTPFQLEVWTLLKTIPYGQTATYADIARRLGRPSACRAVGAANGRNPIPIIIPCHRVIGTDGSLTGFGGGLAIKQALLKLEARGRRAIRPDMLCLPRKPEGVAPERL